jgi:hypothetical protein
MRSDEPVERIGHRFETLRHFLDPLMVVAIDVELVEPVPVVERRSFEDTHRVTVAVIVLHIHVSERGVFLPHDVRVQRAALDHVEELDAAANPQNGNAPLERPAAEPELVVVLQLVELIELGRGAVAFVVAGIDVAALDHQESRHPLRIAGQMTLRFFGNGHDHRLEALTHDERHVGLRDPVHPLVLPQETPADHHHAGLHFRRLFRDVRRLLRDF